MKNSTQRPLNPANPGRVWQFISYCLSAIKHASGVSSDSGPPSVLGWVCPVTVAIKFIKGDCAISVDKDEGGVIALINNKTLSYIHTFFWKLRFSSITF